MQLIQSKLRRSLWFKLVAIVLAVMLAVPALAGTEALAATDDQVTNNYEYPELDLDAEVVVDDNYDDAIAPDQHELDASTLAAAIIAAQALMGAFDDAAALAALEAVIVAAEAVLANPADQYEIDAAVTALEKVVSELAALVNLPLDPFSIPGVLVIPTFLPGFDPEDLTVTVSDGILAWGSTQAQNIEAPGPVFIPILDGFLVTEPGWYTVFSFGDGFYSLQTYFYVAEDLFTGTGIIFKNLLIENNLRAATFQTFIQGNFVTRHEFESVLPTGIVRLPSYLDRYDVSGNWTIAAVTDRATQRFALGSDVAPWSGPNHFQTPVFRNNVYDENGWLAGNSERPLYQWTTYEEMIDFLTELDQIAPQMYLFSAGYAPHAFADIANPEFFGMPFAVFTTYDLSSADGCYIAAGAIIRNSDKPTLFHGAGIHGNEQSSREAALAIVYALAATPWGREVVEDINVIVLPDINPTGHRQHNRRSMTVSGTASRPGQSHMDMNRDHMTLHTQEIWQVHHVWAQFLPHVMTDGHELGTWSYNAQGWYNNADDFQVSPATALNVEDSVVALAATMQHRQFADGAASGIRTTHFGVTNNPAIGRAFYGHMNAASFVLETRGQSAGLQARRTYAQYMSVRSFIEFMRENAAEVMTTVDEARADVIEMGRIYDPTNRIVLQQAATGGIDPRLAVGQRFNLHLTDGYELGGLHTNNLYVMQRDRSRPTGYIVPLAIDWLPHAVDGQPIISYEEAINRLRRTLRGQGIEHYIVIADSSTLPLQQYFVASDNANPMTTAFAADLRPLEEITLDGSFIFIPMDQVAGTVIALTMEPDIIDGNAANWTPANPEAETGGSFASSWVQALVHTPENALYDRSRTLLHCPETMNLPIFRLTEDNPREFVLGAPAAPLVVSASDIERAVRGRYIDVVISLDNNSDGLSSMLLNVGYDAAVLEKVAIATGDILPLPTLPPAGANPLRLSFIDFANPLGVVNDTGDLAVITFRVLNDAPAGTTPITLNIAGAYRNENFVPVPILSMTVNGSVNVVAFIPGDINGDGVVDAADLMLLSMYLAGHDVVICRDAADINGDGLITSADLILLSLYLAGHPIILGQPSSTGIALSMGLAAAMVPGL